MPDSGSDSVRIHCICGQKMKISESMYGLPGKCTSCRQKIRLPRADELPTGSLDIYLDEQPELLREGSNGKRGAVKAGAVRNHPHIDDSPTPVTELDLSDSAEASQVHMIGSVPLDPLPSMQTLASFQLRLERKIQIIDAGKSRDKDRRAELKGRLKRVRGMRKDLDEQIHQFLMEVAIKLTSTHENIADLQLAARVDEVSFDQFQDEVSTLRIRRDHLERQQLNLRGWLATVGPSAVGGYRDVTIDELPDDGFVLEVSIEPGKVDSLLNAHADSLKRAFRNDEKAGRKLAKIKKQRKTSDPKERARLKDPYAHAKASKAIAEMQIGHFQQRLNLMIQDHEGDLETLDAQMATARDKLSVDQLERSDYDRLKENATLTKIDIKKVCNVARRLEQAKSASAVSVPEGVYSKRKSRSKSTGISKMKKATVVLWVIVLLMVLITFLPISWKLPFLKGIYESSDSDTSAPEVTSEPMIDSIEPVDVEEEATEPEAVEVEVVTPATVETEAVEPEVVEPVEESDAEAPFVPTARLKGVMTGANGSVKFSVEVVTDPARPGMTFRVNPKETLLNGWVVSEYNTRGYLVLRRGKEELFLYRGEDVPLPEISEPLVAE